MVPVEVRTTCELPCNGLRAPSDFTPADKAILVAMLDYLLVNSKRDYVI